ncbi:hypothetical protein ACPPVU_07340 [Mucilaginibacter sp. McL0603]|uniref:hypothetical protein n=1 Tax=Mucilaginibacter sp. McL0603 TaxID=3415670 RepID=UPI003CED8254
MAISLISNIYDNFRETYEDNPQFILDFFQKNIIVFNNVKAFNDEDDLRKYIELSCVYAESLYNKGRYNDTVDSTTDSLSIIDKEILRLNADEIKDDWYYSILFLKGMASYSLKDFKTATPIFKVLILFDPQNEKYGNWLRHSLQKQRQWINTIILIVGTVFILAGAILRFYTKNYMVRQSFPIIGIALLIGNYIFELYSNRSFRKSSRV